MFKRCRPAVEQLKDVQVAFVRPIAVSEECGGMLCFCGGEPTNRSGFQVSETETGNYGVSGSGSHQWELTAGQLGVWHHQRLNPASPIYNIGEYLEIDGNLDLEIFESALRHVVGEVDAFHLHFRVDGEDVRQCIEKSDDWPLHVIDFTAEPDPRSAAETWMETDARRPFDLRNGPIFTEAVLKISSDVFFWYQIVHHIACDGFSEWLVAARVGRVYAALAAGEPVSGGSLEPVSTLLQADYSYRGSAEFERDREFWLGVLAGFEGPVSVSGVCRSWRPG
jgi:nonribosomal peptide synthetase DhbF